LRHWDLRERRLIPSPLDRRLTDVTASLKLRSKLRSKLWTFRAEQGYILDTLAQAYYVNGPLGGGPDDRKQGGGARSPKCGSAGTVR
jgi:hypothetical protein